jgi:hypothetical protein
MQSHADRMGADCRRVMMSADRSVTVGASLLSVGAAIVVARLAYVWQGGGHFWDGIG